MAKFMNKINDLYVVDDFNWKLMNPSQVQFYLNYNNNTINVK